VCHSSEAHDLIATAVGAPAGGRLVVADWQACETHCRAVASHCISDVPGGAISHLRQGVRLVWASKRWIICEGSTAMWASPPREKSSYSINIIPDDHKESSVSCAVESESTWAVGQIRAAVAAGGRRTDDGTSLDTFRMVVDQ